MFNDVQLPLKLNKVHRDTLSYLKAILMYSNLPLSTSFTQQHIESYNDKILYGRYTFLESTKSRFRLTLSCWSTTSTIDEVQQLSSLAHVILSYLLCPRTSRMHILPARCRRGAGASSAQLKSTSLTCRCACRCGVSQCSHRHRCS